MPLIRVNRDDILDYAQKHRAALESRNQQDVAFGSFQQWLARMGRGEGMPHAKGVRLSDKDLSYADFSDVKFENCTFERATLDQADFSGATMTKNCFVGASANGTNFVGADLKGASFEGAKMLALGPLASDKQRAITDFSGANCAKVNFENSHCRNVVFTYANLPDAYFAGAELENVNFKHANMVGIDLLNSKPQFRENKSSRNHPIGIELTGAVVIDGKGMEGYAGHLQDSIESIPHLAIAVRRMALMGQGQEGFLSDQTKIRSKAAESVLQRHSGEGVAELEEALGKLKKTSQVQGEFTASVVGSRDNALRKR